MLAFQGICIEVRDLFLKKSNQIETSIYSVLANLDIAYQTILAYESTHEAVELSRRLNYSLSFTGYSFGAWLAEQSVFFCHREFNKPGVRAVTFESPGSYDYLLKLNERNIVSHETYFDLKDLDIITYLSAPNFVNTCNKHIGKVYRMYTPFNSSPKSNPSELDKFLDKLSKKVLGIIGKYAFYLNGIKTLFSNGLDAMIGEFNEKTESIAKCYRMFDWPKVSFTPKDEFKNNFKNVFDFEQFIDLINLLTLQRNSAQCR